MTVKTSQDGITEMVQTEIQTMIHKETGWRAAGGRREQTTTLPGNKLVLLYSSTPGHAHAPQLELHLPAHLLMWVLVGELHPRSCMCESMEQQASVMFTVLMSTCKDLTYETSTLGTASQGWQWSWSG